jgi:hypothetical protein
MGSPSTFTVHVTSDGPATAILSFAIFGFASARIFFARSCA